MPSLVSPPVPLAPHYEAAPRTKEALDFADLPVIDLSKYVNTDPAIHTQIVEQVRSAMAEYGLFYIVNHGLTSAENTRIFDIADIPFSQVEEDEKQNYESRLKETGTQEGYKPRQYYHINDGVRDQLEIYALDHDVHKGNHPEALRPFLPELDHFARHSHINVLYPILRLLALGLGLPKDALVDLHLWEEYSTTYMRFMKYYPRTEEEEMKAKSIWLKGHTDIGSITLMYSQPVSALQIRAKDGSWKWVKHMENAIVVNTGDALEFLSGGFYRATTHRVVQPPSDQRAYTRLGLFYFVLPREDLILKPLSDSPILKQTQSGWVNDRLRSVDPPTVEVWRKERIKSYGNETAAEAHAAGKG
ncbi:hypothetical protein GYMLUDRAFT_256067 [Collybiopsis luxurians FD-317 M1]|nr:hypothetical protein GYMLUDRAFT_256067 [Collybiopsis luxurians FD-317 M1]